MDSRLRDDIDTLWRYMQCHEVPGDADCLLVLGSRDDTVASYAAELAQSYSYGTVVVSGGAVEHNPSLDRWPEATEAAHFAAHMAHSGYHGAIVLEERARNTGENARFTYELLRQRDISAPNAVQIVTKPYMERRAKATFEAQWPDDMTRFRVVSRPHAFSDYIAEGHDADEITHKMVGDMQRIIVYPTRGFQSLQHVPQHVHEAYTRLIAAGYTKHLLKI